MFELFPIHELEVIFKASCFIVKWGVSFLLHLLVNFAKIPLELVFLFILTKKRSVGFKKFFIDIAEVCFDVGHFFSFFGKEFEGRQQDTRVIQRDDLNHLLFFSVLVWGTDSHAIILFCNKLGYKIFLGFRYLSNISLDMLHYLLKFYILIHLLIKITIKLRLF